MITKTRIGKKRKTRKEQKRKKVKLSRIGEEYFPVLLNKNCLYPSRLEIRKRLTHYGTKEKKEKPKRPKKKNLHLNAKEKKVKKTN